MSNLISMKDFEISPNKKFSNKSPVLLRALELIKKRRKIKIQNFEEVIDPFELILACNEAMSEFEKRIGNNNNPKGN